MPNQAFIHLATNQVMADILVERFEAAGIPVVAKQTIFPYPTPLAPVEIWLMDKDLLLEPGIAEAIDRILHPLPTDALPEPEETPEEPPNLRIRRIRWIVALTSIAALLVVWGAFFATPRKPSFAFMRRAIRLAPNYFVAEFLDHKRFYGDCFEIRQSSATVLAEASTELESAGFRERDLPDKNVTGHYYVHNDSLGWTDELVIIAATRKQRHNGTMTDDPLSTTIVWAYKPGVGDRLGRLIGL